MNTRRGTPFDSAFSAPAEWNHPSSWDTTVSPQIASPQTVTPTTRPSIVEQPHDFLNLRPLSGIPE
jgi:hypothetical protein